MQAPIAAARDITEWAVGKSDMAASVADRLSSMTNNPDAQRAGQLLNKVLKEPDISARKALMFSLSQQPWFRQAAGKAIGIEGKDEQQ